MNFVIPMAGAGQRFINAGYQTPKPLIKVHGKSLLEWSIDSLPLELCSKLICVVLERHCRQFQLEEFLESKYGNRKFELCIIKLKEVTRGQAETVYHSRYIWDLSNPLLIFNADTAFLSPSLPGFLKDEDYDGVLCSFYSSESRFSYARLCPESGFVIETAEKRVISNYALNGLYHFKKPQDFISSFEYNVLKNLKVGGEFYVAPLYNYLINAGNKIVLNCVQENYILGTPEELIKFKP